MTTKIQHPAISISLGGYILMLTKDEKSCFTLYGKNRLLPKLDVEFQFDAAQVLTLGLLCLQHFPDIQPRYAIAGEAEAYRLPARKLMLVDDRSIQLLLREVMTDTTIDFLWYMADAELAKKFFRNMSQRAAEFLFDDIDHRYCNLNPDTAPMTYVEHGWEAILRIIETYDRLADEGQVLKI